MLIQLLITSFPIGQEASTNLWRVKWKMTHRCETLNLTGASRVAAVATSPFQTGPGTSTVTMPASRLVKSPFRDPADIEIMSEGSGSSANA